MLAIIAHRGRHDHHPENTLAAFSAAAEAGATMVECDLRRTQDGALAIFHDPEIDRRPLANLTLAELRDRSGIAVPTLEELLDWASAAGVGIDLELKEDGYVDTVTDALTGFPGPLWLTSFLDPVLAQLAERLPDVERGLLLSLTARAAAARVRDCGAHGAVIEVGLLSAGVLDELVGAGLRAAAWDFLPERRGHAEWLADPRLHAVITDDVPGTRAALAHFPKDELRR
ncbi:glycerophosphodiester phosphodiesterase [Conexibacter sp. DBS9H8]|uniref:glycerophosphodiester phosphodiesterase n=1 Tax=Conexibacter sp. DBS9H8 TaxID=2937801 RepID=UPI00200DC33D|nr:glycerophosphodiester phosphodiesterase [Conexibacter sp. DBS9H8]